jgi:O-antigen/teichoic acid export membrane protein
MAASSAEGTLELAAITEQFHRDPAVQETIRGRLLGGVSWSAAGAVLSQGCSFLTLVLLARILGRAPFGQFALIQSTMVSLTTISGLGLGITATKYASQYRTSDPEKTGRILGLSALVTLAAAICFTTGLGVSAGFASFGAASSGELQACLRISMAYVFFSTITGYQIGALAGFEAFRGIAAINTICGVAALAMSWAFTVQWGLRGAVWGQSAGAVLAWALYQGALAGHCRERRIVIRYREAWRERNILLRFALPAAACGMVSSAAAWLANVLLVRLGGFAELAIFSAALSMRSMVLFAPALIVRVTTPVLNNLLASGNLRAHRKILWRTAGVNGLIALIAAVFLSIAGRQVLQLFGRDFHCSGWIVPLLLASVVLEVLANNLFQALFTSGRLWRNLGIICAWAAVLLVATNLLSPGRGAVGLAGAYLVAWSVSASLYLAAALRYSRHGRDYAST